MTAAGQTDLETYRAALARIEEDLDALDDQTLLIADGAAGADDVSAQTRKRLEDEAEALRRRIAQEEARLRRA